MAAGRDNLRMPPRGQRTPTRSFRPLGRPPPRAAPGSAPLQSSPRVPATRTLGSPRVSPAPGRKGSHIRAPGLTLAAQAARRASAAARSSSCRARSSHASSANSSALCSWAPGTNAGCEASGGQAPRTVSCRERPTWEGRRPHSPQRHSPDPQPAGTDAQGSAHPGSHSKLDGYHHAGMEAREALKPVFWKAEDH